MRECCASLTQRKECESDKWIWYFVKVHVLSRRVSDTFCYPNVSTCTILGEQAIRIALDSYESEFEELKSICMTGLMGRNISLLLDLDFLEVWTHEIALYNDVWKNPYLSIDSLEQARNRGSIFCTLRTNRLWHTVFSTNSFRSTFLKIECQDLFALPFSSWTTLSYVLIVQAKVAFLNSESPPLRPYDEKTQQNFRKAAAKELHVPMILTQHLQRLALISTDDLDEERERDTMYMYGSLLKGIRSGYESRIKAEGGILFVQQAEERVGHTQNNSSQILRYSLPSVTTQTGADLQEPLAMTGNKATLLDVQMDQFGAGFDDFLWKTMMNDFSFLIPQNESS